MTIKDSTGSTFNRGDFTTTNAFFWSSLDLSALAGTDLGSTPFYIEVLDGAGKKATGHLAAVGAGETLGDELLSNPSFDVDTGGWSTSEATIASILGGQSGKCCEVTRVSGISQGIYQNIGASLVVNGLYKTLSYVKSGTSGNENYTVSLGTDTEPIIGVSSGSWVQSPARYDNFISDGYIRIYKKSSTAGTMLFDEASSKRVTDPPSTAVHIVSTLNGTIRDWASIDSGFDPNGIVSWIIFCPVLSIQTYEVKPTPPT